MPMVKQVAEGNAIYHTSKKELVKLPNQNIFLQENEIFLDAKYLISVLKQRIPAVHILIPDS